MMHASRPKVVAILLVLPTLFHWVTAISGQEVDHSYLVKPDGSVVEDAAPVGDTVGLKLVRPVRKVVPLPEMRVSITSGGDADVGSKGSAEIRISASSNPAAPLIGSRQEMISTESTVAPRVGTTFPDNLISETSTGLAVFASKLSVAHMIFANATRSVRETVYDTVTGIRAVTPLPGNATFNTFESSYNLLMPSKDYIFALLLVLGSLSLVVPAALAASEGWYWLALLFIARAVVCASSNTYVTSGFMSDSRSFSAEVSPSERFAHELWLLSVGLTYYVILQMALAVMGPEDLVLHRVDENVEAHMGGHAGRLIRHLFHTHETIQRQKTKTPLDVLLINRVGTSMAMVMFLRMHQSWQGFHWTSILLCTAMFLMNIGIFWVVRYKQAVGVLLRYTFWERGLGYVAFPILACVIMLAGMQTCFWCGSPLFRTLCDLSLSGWAFACMRRVINGDGASFGYADEVHNPVIAHHATWVCPVLGFCAYGLVMGSLELPLTFSSYIGIFGAMLALVSSVVTWCAVGLTIVFHASEDCVKGNAAQIRGKPSAGMQAMRYDESTVTILMGCAVAVGSSILSANACYSALTSKMAQGIEGFLVVALIALQTVALARGSSISSRVSVSNHAKHARRCRLVIASMQVFLAVGLAVAICVSFHVRAGASSTRESMSTRATVKHAALFTAILSLIWPLTWFWDAKEALPFKVQRYRLAYRDSSAEYAQCALAHAG